MKKIYFLISSILLVSCAGNNERYYRKITEEEYNKFLIADTVVKKSNYLILNSNGTISREIGQLIMRKMNPKEMGYYVFDPDCYVENDSTIIAYAPPFKSDSDTGSFQKDGVWFYAGFYSDQNKEGNAIYETSDAGVNFSVDSLPKNLKITVLPKSEGIYFYQKEALVQVTKEQSEDKFSSLQKNGFYFIPNTGRLFTRLKIKDIE